MRLRTLMRHKARSAKQPGDPRIASGRLRHGRSRRPDRGAAVTTTGRTAQWIDQERRRRREREENLPGRVRLLPPERFSDEPATSEDFARACERGDPALTGRNSDAVHWRIVNSCSGWKQRPTAGEFYDAIHAEDPTGRQKALISMWANEADWRELLQAWAQRAYTLQALVRALHRAGHDRCRHARLINCWRAGNRDAAR